MHWKFDTDLIDYDQIEHCVLLHLLLVTALKVHLWFYQNSVQKEHDSLIDFRENKNFMKNNLHRLWPRKTG